MARDTTPQTEAPPLPAEVIALILAHGLRAVAPTSEPWRVENIDTKICDDWYMYREPPWTVVWQLSYPQRRFEAYVED